MPSAGLSHIGFVEPPQRRERHRAIARAQVVAVVTLAVSISVAAVVVSIGIVRAGAVAESPLSASQVFVIQPPRWQAPGS